MDKVNTCSPPLAAHLSTSSSCLFALCSFHENQLHVNAEHSIKPSKLRRENWNFLLR